jgi:hypothetical protein
MRLSLRSFSLATVAAAALAVAPAAHADTMYAIGSTAPTTVGGPLSVVSASVLSNTGSYTISYTAEVFEDAGPAHSLDFFYHITGFSSTSDAVTQLSIGGYAASDLLAVEAVGSGQAPTSPADLSSLTGVLDVNFHTNPIANGDTSQTLWLLTNASFYTFGTFSSQDGSVAQLQGYAPINPTPEPSTFALMGTGLLAAAGAIRRRVKA